MESIVKHLPFCCSIRMYLMVRKRKRKKIKQIMGNVAFCAHSPKYMTYACACVYIGVNKWLIIIIIYNNDDTSTHDNFFALAIMILSIGDELNRRLCIICCVQYECEQVCHTIWRCQSTQFFSSKYTHTHVHLKTQLIFGRQNRDSLKGVNKLNKIINVM